jgi:hypothetical protein
VAQRLKAHRHDLGALELESIEARAQFDGDSVSGLAAEKPNRARTLIEDFMIAANGSVARFLEAHRFPVLRRVVRSPERWQRIVALAADLGERLPGEPDAPALNAFLLKQRDADPLRFPDLSLTVIKLLGRGEYVASFAGQGVVGHFGLAVSEYTHSTAPNRRYPDLLTQRLVRAALAEEPVPYGRDELGTLAAECTLKEDAAQKVERLVRKAAAGSSRAGSAGRRRRHGRLGEGHAVRISTRRWRDRARSGGLDGGRGARGRAHEPELGSRLRERSVRDTPPAPSAGILAPVASPIDRLALDRIARAVVSGRRGLGRRADRLADAAAGMTRNQLAAMGAAGGVRAAALAARRRPLAAEPAVLRRILARVSKHLAAGVARGARPDAPSR